MDPLERPAKRLKTDNQPSAAPPLLDKTALTHHALPQPHLQHQSSSKHPSQASDPFPPSCHVGTPSALSGHLTYQAVNATQSSFYRPPHGAIYHAVPAPELTKNETANETLGHDSRFGQGTVANDDSADTSLGGGEASLVNEKSAQKAKIKCYRDSGYVSGNSSSHAEEQTHLDTAGTQMPYSSNESLPLKTAENQQIPTTSKPSHTITADTQILSLATPLQRSLKDFSCGLCGGAFFQDVDDFLEMLGLWVDGHSEAVCSLRCRDCKSNCCPACGAVEGSKGHRVAISPQERGNVKDRLRPSTQKQKLLASTAREGSPVPEWCCCHATMHALWDVLIYFDFELKRRTHSIISLIPRLQVRDSAKGIGYEAESDDMDDYLHNAQLIEMTGEPLSFPKPSTIHPPSSLASGNIGKDSSSQTVGSMSPLSQAMESKGPTVCISSSLSDSKITIGSILQDTSNVHHPSTEHLQTSQLHINVSSHHSFTPPTAATAGSGSGAVEPTQLSVAIPSDSQTVLEPLRDNQDSQGRRSHSLPPDLITYQSYAKSFKDPYTNDPVETSYERTEITGQNKSAPPSSTKSGLAIVIPPSLSMQQTKPYPSFKFGDKVAAYDHDLYPPLLKAKPISAHNTPSKFSALPDDVTKSFSYSPESPEYSSASYLAKGTGYGGIDGSDLDEYSLMHPTAVENRLDLQEEAKKSLEAYEEALIDRDRFTKASLGLLNKLLIQILNATKEETADVEDLSRYVASSMILDTAAEILRNDCLEDVVKRADLCRTVFDLTQTLAHYQVTQHLVYAQRHAKPHSELLHPPTVEGRKSATEKQPSLQSCMINLTKQCRIILSNKSIKKARKDLGDTLDMSKAVVQLSDSLCLKISSSNNSIPQIPLVSNSELDSHRVWEAYHAAHAFAAVPDKLIFATHAYAEEAQRSHTAPLGRMKRLISEGANLSTSLPSGIFVRHAETRPDVIKVLIFGPSDTPYAHGIFEFDFWCTGDYPTAPPRCKFKTTGGGRAHFNPNLYPDGFVCLSLLNTWDGERWAPGRSTLLQVLVSLQAMVLCEMPWYNEPGREMEDWPGAKEESRNYNNDIQALTVKWAMLDWIQTVSKDNHRGSKAGQGEQEATGEGDDEAAQAKVSTSPEPKALWTDVVTEYLTHNYIDVLTTAVVWLQETTAKATSPTESSRSPWYALEQKRKMSHDVLELANIVRTALLTPQLQLRTSRSCSPDFGLKSTAFVGLLTTQDRDAMKRRLTDFRLEIERLVDTLAAIPTPEQPTRRHAKSSISTYHSFAAGAAAAAGLQLSPESGVQNPNFHYSVTSGGVTLASGPSNVTSAPSTKAVSGSNCTDADSENENYDSDNMEAHVETSEPTAGEAAAAVSAAQLSAAESFHQKVKAAIDAAHEQGISGTAAYGTPMFLEAIGVTPSPPPMLPSKPLSHTLPHTVVPPGFGAGVCVAGPEGSHTANSNLAGSGGKSTATPTWLTGAGSGAPAWSEIGVPGSIAPPPGSMFGSVWGQGTSTGVSATPWHSGSGANNGQGRHGLAQDSYQPQAQSSPFPGVLKLETVALPSVVKGGDEDDAMGEGDDIV